MTESFRALLVVLVIYMLAFVIFEFAFASYLNRAYKAAKKIKSIFMLGALVLIASYLLHSIQVFLLVFAVIAFFAGRLHMPSMAVFIFLGLLTPIISMPLPTFGIIQNFLDVDHIRVLSAIVLFPASISVRHKRPHQARNVVTTLVFAYVMFVAFCNGMGFATFTGGLKSAVSGILDILLVYLAASSIRDRDDLQLFMMVFALISLFVALVAVFEFFKGWLLFEPVRRSLTLYLDPGGSYYGMREGALRASSSAMNPIALGFMCTLPIIFLFYWRKWISDSTGLLLLALVLVGGIVAPISRGPWVGAAAGLLCAWAFMWGAAGAIGIGSMIIVLGTAAAYFFPFAARLMQFLPWIGTVDAGGITYREYLKDAFAVFIKNHFWMGSVKFTEDPIFNTIRYDNGFVDIVNSYVGIAAYTGMIGLGLYLAVFGIASWRLLRWAALYQRQPSALRLLAVLVLSNIVASSVTITTVSSISFISYYLWMLVGLAVCIDRLCDDEWRGHRIYQMNARKLLAA